MFGEIIIYLLIYIFNKSKTDEIILLVLKEIRLKTTLPQMVQPSFLFQAFSTNGLITDEYLKKAQTPEEIRDAFTEVIGDILMTFPVIKVARYHSGLRS